MSFHAPLDIAENSSQTVSCPTYTEQHRNEGEERDVVWKSLAKGIFLLLFIKFCLLAKSVRTTHPPSTNLPHLLNSKMAKKQHRLNHSFLVPEVEGGDEAEKECYMICQGLC